MVIRPLTRKATRRARNFCLKLRGKTARSTLMG